MRSHSDAEGCEGADQHGAGTRIEHAVHRPAAWVDHGHVAAGGGEGARDLEPDEPAAHHRDRPGMRSQVCGEGTAVGGVAQGERARGEARFRLRAGPGDLRGARSL